MAAVRFPDTIYALSSGGLPAGVAVIRVSGTGARSALEMLAGGLPVRQRASLRDIKSADGQLIDRAIVLFFEGPHSLTGEDVAEIHVHGGRAVVAALFGALAGLGSRLAEPGEFMRRAFLNGRIDLLGAEALGDLIEAQTEAQRRLAQLNAGGLQSALYDSWRTQLIAARALIEAELDFPDEADVPGSVSDRVWVELAGLVTSMTAHIARFRTAEIVRDGYQVVIIGPPNAGKSSLLNALANRDVAIVSDEPGTTRDLVEVSLDIGGMKVNVTDTAGLRQATGVEAIGIGRAVERAHAADLVLLVSAVDGGNLAGFLHDGVAVLPVLSKIDLSPDSGVQGVLGVSAVTGAGIDRLIELIGAEARGAGDLGGEAMPTRIRHVALLSAALASVHKAVGSASLALELRAEMLRSASEDIGRVAGRVDVEDILDEVFSRFCLGK